jgi:hypothetical protein
LDSGEWEKGLVLVLAVVEVDGRREKHSFAALRITISALGASSSSALEGLLR